MRNPCNGCALSITYAQKNRNIYKPDFRSKECIFCQSRQEYQVFRETKKQFCKGDPLRSVAEFDEWIQENTYVFWNDKVKHRSILISMQYRVVANALAGGLICKALFKNAVPKEEVTIV